MESSTSKIGINILIVVAILLICTSIAGVLIKKPVEVVMLTTPPKETAPQPMIQEPITVSTTTEATTTEEISTSTSTATSTVITIKGFTDKSWTWTKTTKGNSTSTTPKKTTAFTITFNGDGTLKGTTDCNGFFGTYKATSSKLTFGPLGATLMYCDGSQESEFMTSLQGVTGYLVDKTNNLILTNGSGTMMFK